MTDIYFEIFHLSLFVHMFTVGMEIDAGDSGSEGDFCAAFFLLDFSSMAKCCILMSDLMG